MHLSIFLQCIELACTQKRELNFFFVKCFSGPAPVYQDLSTHHDWPVKKAIVDLPVRLNRDMRNTFSVICSIHWEPRTRISVLLHKHY